MMPCDNARVAGSEQITSSVAAGQRADRIEADVAQSLPDFIADAVEDRRLHSSLDE